MAGGILLRLPKLFRSRAVNCHEIRFTATRKPPRIVTPTAAIPFARSNRGLPLGQAFLNRSYPVCHHASLKKKSVYLLYERSRNCGREVYLRAGTSGSCGIAWLSEMSQPLPYMRFKFEDITLFNETIELFGKFVSFSTGLSSRVTETSGA